MEVFMHLWDIRIDIDVTERILVSVSVQKLIIMLNLLEKIPNLRDKIMVFSGFVQNRPKSPLSRGRPKNMGKSAKNRNVWHFEQPHSVKIMFYDQTDIRNRFFIIKLTLEHLVMSIALHKMLYRKTKRFTRFLHA